MIYLIRHYVRIRDWVHYLHSRTEFYEPHINGRLAREERGEGSNFTASNTSPFDYLIMKCVVRKLVEKTGLESWTLPFSFEVIIIKRTLILDKIPRYSKIVCFIGKFKLKAKKTVQTIFENTYLVKFCSQ